MHYNVCLVSMIYSASLFRAMVCPNVNDSYSLSDVFAISRFREKIASRNGAPIA